MKQGAISPPGVRRFGAFLLAAFSSSVMATQYDCVDERGMHHRVHYKIATELIHFDCTAVPDAGESVSQFRLGRHRAAVLSTNLAGDAIGESEWPLLPLQILVPSGRRAVSQQAPEPIDSLIRSTAAQFDHDPDLLRAIIKVESGFNVRAQSPKGAIGLMQLMPATARRFGWVESESLFIPDLNLEIGARYLAHLKQLFPAQPELMIAAYNAGEAAVIQHKHQIPPYPETQSYVRSVVAAYRDFRAQTGTRRED